MPTIIARAKRREKDDTVRRFYEVAERIARDPNPSEADMREYARLSKDLSFSDYLRIDKMEAEARGSESSSR